MHVHIVKDLLLLCCGDRPSRPLTVLLVAYRSTPPGDYPCPVPEKLWNGICMV